MPPRPNYLANHGLDLIALGYPIIPIKPGTKAPHAEEWNKIRATAAQHSRWLKDGYGSFGIGIITEHFPAIDIDTLNAGLAEDMVDWCLITLGDAPVRVGWAPKTLLLFGTDEPFNKRFSSEWSDNPPQFHANGKMIVHHLEVLGKGQQFVAYAIHPDTKQPYEWKSEAQPLNFPSDDLPRLTAADADMACAAFDRFAEKHGLLRLRQARSRAAPAVNGHDWTADIATKVGFTLDQMRETLADVPAEDADDFERWFQIGMGIYHETDGSEDGFDMWDHWSEQSAKYQHGVTADKWKTFAIEGKERAPITFRYVMKRAQANQAAALEAVFDQVKTELAAVRTKADYKAAEHRIKHTELDPLDRTSLKNALMEAYARAYGAKMPLALANQRIRAAPPPAGVVPDWLAPFVFDESENQFFNRTEKTSLTAAAFNSNHNRHVMTPADRAAGKAKPDASASDWATNVYQIQTVAGIRYCPWEKPLFHRGGKLYANRYSDALIPAVPAKLSHRQEQAIFIFQRHLEHMIIDPRERDLFLDWLCYTVKTGHRCNWAVVMLGCEGDGKTWFGGLMDLVLGEGNVKVVAAADLEQRFTSWAEGAQVVVVEEIRFAGHNRHEIMNKLKPFITNHPAVIEHKYQTPYQTVNTTQYLMFTNHADALPVDDANSRYFIIRSRWQRRAKILAFQAENPTYYAELMGLLDDPDAIAAIRKHMLEKEPHPEFSAVKRAPDSEGKRYMAEMARDTDTGALLDEIKRGDKPLLCRTLTSTAHAQQFLQQDTGGPPPRAEAIGRILRREEFESLGQVRVDGVRLYLWSTTPERFQQDRKTVPKLIVDYVRNPDNQEV